jgi:hypothetical protein
LGTRTRPLVSRLNISPLSSGVDVIEIVYDIYAIPNSGPPRDAYPQSEVAAKTKHRFEKNRNTLFTFLKHDGVPWNNNNAEHAIKAFATLRRVINGVTSEAGLRDYLVLLSICETCEYQGLEFLDFLRSGETDIAGFADSRSRPR